MIVATKIKSYCSILNTYVLYIFIYYLIFILAYLSYGIIHLILFYKQAIDPYSLFLFKYFKGIVILLLRFYHLAVKLRVQLNGFVIKTNIIQLYYIF